MKEEEELLLVQERRQREKRKWELDQEEHNKKMCLYDAVLDLIQVGSFGHNIISRVSVRNSFCLGATNRICCGIVRIAS